MPAAERPRERLALRGPGGLSAAELIAVVLTAFSLLLYAGIAYRLNTDLNEELNTRRDQVDTTVQVSASRPHPVRAYGPYQHPELNRHFLVARYCRPNRAFVGRRRDRFVG
jgi:DNA repair protein RadC